MSNDVKHTPLFTVYVWQYGPNSEESIMQLTRFMLFIPVDIFVGHPTFIQNLSIFALAVDNSYFQITK